ncbi:SH3 domain-containing protein [Tenuifilum thalassicum]|nr:SH3 domain-containing protein [Tenuifilum thalassicum]
MKKGDVIVILEEKGKWLRIEYSDDYKQGWIRKEDINMK